VAQHLVPSPLHTNPYLLPVQPKLSIIQGLKKSFFPVTKHASLIAWIFKSLLVSSFTQTTVIVHKCQKHFKKVLREREIRPRKNNKARIADNS
jgi:hypothetical protein